MTVLGYAILATGLFSLIYGILIYNRLVRLKHNVRMAWGNIDVLLKQRHDEIPKLVAACKQYMTYEQATLERVITARQQVAQARESSDVTALGLAETTLRSSLGQLFALVENYPELKADESFRQLRGRITGLENAIADRREFYNESVNLNNIGIEEFPNNLVASHFRFGPFRVLRFADVEKTDVDVAALFQT